MNILEKEIEDVVFDTIVNNPKALKNRGLRINTGLYYERQMQLGEYGIADILGYGTSLLSGGSRCVYAHIIEIKKEQINIGTLLQATRYARALQRIVRANLKNAWLDIHISLIGKTIDTKSDFVYMADIFRNVDFYTYSIDLEQGVRFTRQEGYFLSNESLPDVSGVFNDLKLLIKSEIDNKQELPF